MSEANVLFFSSPALVGILAWLVLGEPVSLFGAGPCCLQCLQARARECEKTYHQTCCALAVQSRLVCTDSLRCLVRAAGLNAQAVLPALPLQPAALAADRLSGLSLSKSAAVQAALH